MSGFRFNIGDRVFQVHAAPEEAFGVVVFQINLAEGPAYIVRDSDGQDYPWSETEIVPASEVRPQITVGARVRLADGRETTAETGPFWQLSQEPSDAYFHEGDLEIIE